VWEILTDADRATCRREPAMTGDQHSGGSGPASDVWSWCPPMSTSRTSGDLLFGMGRTAGQKEEAGGRRRRSRRHLKT
jgi:hypothetical protein